MHRSFFLMTFSFLEGSKWERKFQHLVTTSTKPRRPHKYKNKSRQRRMKKQGKRVYAHEQTWKKKDVPKYYPHTALIPSLTYMYGLYSFSFSATIPPGVLHKNTKKGEGECTRKTLKSWKMAPRREYSRVSRVSLFFQVKRLYLNIWRGCTTGTYSFRVSVVPLCHCCYFSSCSRPSTAEDGSSSNKSFPVELSWLNTYTNE
jgi:hypothetical protein